ncbi:MAG: hypothetical protein IJI14_16010 [Anaerolineaceae bacterium]|nr:hypothetical protein [Anaerolineaceae bacterium]
MNKYLSPNDDIGALLMNIGYIAKGYGGQGKKMGQTDEFNVVFKKNADPEIVKYFQKIYGETPKRINFYLPCNDIDKCVVSPYKSYNKAQTLLARSEDGKFFSYIANLENPLDKKNAYLRNGKRTSDGARIEYQPDLGFLGKPNAKMAMAGEMFVFVKELLEEGVFQTMAVRFHTTTDRDMLKKRLSYVQEFAHGFGVPLTAIPFFITKFQTQVSFTDYTGNAKKSNQYYLDLGMMHFIGSESKHPIGAAFTASWREHGQEELPSSGAPLLPESKDAEPEIVNEGLEEIDDADDTILYNEDENQNEADVETANKDAHTEQDRRGESSVKSEDNEDLKNKLFILNSEQREFSEASLCKMKTSYAVRAEYLSEFKDRNGKPITDLSLEEVRDQLAKADEYLTKIRNKEITVDREKEITAKMRFYALICAGLILCNRYNFY